MKKRNTDVIPAMLSPHEAVLNRKAADLLGRDKIKKLNAKGNAMERYQRGTSDVGRDDRADLLAEASNTFYGGGHAPAPTPTPTPNPRGYQYGTSNVQRGIDYASSPTASPTGAQGFGGSPTAQMGGSPGNLSTNSIPYGGSGNDPVGQGGGFPTSSPTYTGASRDQLFQQSSSQPQGIRPIIGYQAPFQADVYNYGTNNQLASHYTGNYSLPIYGELGAKPYAGPNPNDTVIPSNRKSVLTNADIGFLPPNSPGQGNPHYQLGSFGPGLGGGMNNASPYGSGTTQYFGGGGGGSQPYSAPSFGGGGTNPTASSRGTSPLSAPIPDLRYADPNTLKQLDISNLIYSPQRGGYITAADEARNPSGMYYNRQIQGSDSGNRAASAYYNYIGGLPTQPIGTPALRQLYGMTGQSPTPGPSYNSILGSPYKGPYGFGG